MQTTTEDVLANILLTGKKINKYDFLNLTNSVCLAQRIKDLKKQGWNIKSQSVKGKGTLKEYWIDDDEIERQLY